MNRETLTKQLETTFKNSAPLLNLRKIQDNFAKQKNYKSAHDVQTQANALEAKERDQWQEACHKKILASEQTLMKKQTIEMSAFKRKLEMHMNERVKMREQEHSKILQRYQNVKKEIENQQNIERVKREQAYKVRPATAQARANVSQSKMGASTIGRK